MLKKTKTNYEDSADNDALGTALHGQIRVYVELQVNVSVVLKYPVRFEKTGPTPDGQDKVLA